VPCPPLLAVLAHGKSRPRLVNARPGRLPPQVQGHNTEHGPDFGLVSLASTIPGRWHLGLTRLGEISLLPSESSLMAKPSPPGNT
jgi:hypothetical protein